MSTRYTLSELERFVDGDCTSDEAADIESGMAQDPDIAREVERLEHLNQVVRLTGLAHDAPESLRLATENRFNINNEDAQRSVSSSDGSRRRLNRRVMLAGSVGALAAGLAGFAIIPRLGRVDPVETFFTLDVAATDMVQLAGWFGGRLPFDLPPVSAKEGDVKLVGGRLCWLLDRRLASLSYETAQGPVVLYIMSAKGIDAPAGHDKPEIGHSVSWHRSTGKASLIWSSQELLFVMVGSQDVHNLMSIARALTS
jgi:anti-sigma factor RsiW